MFCKNCGHKVSENSKFCTECGYTLNNQNNGPNSASQSYNNPPQGIPNGYNQGINYYNPAPPYNNFPPQNVSNGLINNNCLYQTKAEQPPFVGGFKAGTNGTVFLYNNELIYKYWGGGSLGGIPFLAIQIASLINQKRMVLHYDEINAVYNKGKYRWWGCRLNIVLNNGETIEMCIPSKNCQLFLSILNENIEKSKLLR